MNTLQAAEDSSGLAQSGQTNEVAVNDGSMPKTQVAEDEQAAMAHVQSVRPGFTDMWLAYRATVMDCAERINKVRAQRFGSLDVGQCFGTEFNDHYMLRESKGRIESAVYTLAEETFAPEGGRLKIERIDIDLGEDEKFDPDRLWAALEAEYGGDAGIELARKQLAAILVDKFCLNRRDPVRKQNRLVLEQHTYAEKRFSGGWEYSYSTVNCIRQAHSALVEFCRWAEDHETSWKIEESLRNFRSFEKLESRERKDYGAVHTISFKERMQYELYGALGEKFHEFIALYGAEALEDKH